MWLEKTNKDDTLRLISETFMWDELWEAAVELNQLCAAKDIDKRIPRNIDQGDQKDRVKVLAIAMVDSLEVMKSKEICPVFIVTTEKLYFVPGVRKDIVRVEPCVTARLENIEKMMETLAKDMREVKAAKIAPVPEIQITSDSSALVNLPTSNTDGNNSSSVHVKEPNRGVYSGNLATDHKNRERSKSPSVKRKAGDDPQNEQSTSDQNLPWNEVVSRNQRRARQGQQGTARTKVVPAGGQAAPFNIVVGNTHPDSTKEIIENVLLQISNDMLDDKKVTENLEILEVECLTKPRDDGRRVWSKTWRVQVPNKFKDHMMRSDSIPEGWTSRRYFPPKAPRPPKAPLTQLDGQPPSNIAEQSKS